MTHAQEPHGANHGSALNSLRAGVLGANDGIVSVAALLLGMAGSHASDSAILTGGIAATIAGAVSMALGEYVSVSAQRDSEKMLIAKEKQELKEIPEEEHEELVEILTGYGMTRETAHQATREIESGDLLAAHLRLELGIDGEDLTNPWAAAGWSAVSFLAGAALPMLAMVLAPFAAQAAVVAVTTIVALAITGFVSAKLADTAPIRSIVRLVVGGALGLAVTYGIGAAFGGVVG
ncbi:VIT family protein [Corynebacterium phoceense]|uniref:VIT family protein n=1 Tax=Corynebacterium phoceense TaxID=1686286 RepID=UPI0034CDEC21